MVSRCVSDAAFSERQQRVVITLRYCINRIEKKEKRSEAHLNTSAYEIFTFFEMYFRSVQSGTSRIFAAIRRIAT